MVTIFIFQFHQSEQISPLIKTKDKQNLIKILKYFFLEKYRVRMRF